MKIHMILSDNGDWYGLYVDGKLTLEGHSLSAETVLEALEGELGIEFGQTEQYLEDTLASDLETQLEIGGSNEV